MSGMEKKLETNVKLLINLINLLKNMLSFGKIFEKFLEKSLFFKYKLYTNI